MISSQEQLETHSVSMIDIDKNREVWNDFKIRGIKRMCRRRFCKVL